MVSVNSPGEECVVVHLTADDVLQIHDRLIAEHGGMSGVLNLGTVEFAVAAASRKKDIVYEAAAILEFIAKNHPFLDGNKRTAFASAATILRLGGFEVGRLMMTLSSSCWRWRRTGSLSPRLRLG